MTTDYETATHLLPKETQYPQCLIGHNKMRYVPPQLFLATAAVTLTLTFSNFTYRSEDNEFTVLITASPTPINTMLTHIYKLREVVDGMKSIKATRKIYNTLSKANKIKEKYEFIVGSQKHNSRGILDSITETTGLVIGRVFGLATAKEESQLSSAIDEIR